MARRLPARLPALVAALCLAQPVPAQERAGPVADSLPLQGPVRSPVLTVDIERLFAESAFGRRAAEELRAETEALAEENAAIVAELQRTEQDLTERRPTMDPAAFREEAAAFDARVQAIRAERDAREVALQSRLGTAREAFLNAATPILGELMLASGAAVLLDRRNVFLGVGLVDVTDAAIARIDAELGDGQGAGQAVEPVPLPDEVQAAPEPAPELTPESAPELTPETAPLDLDTATD